MSVFSSRPALRWLVPAATAVAVIGGGAAIGQLAAVAEPSLPERSAAQLLVDVQTARLDGLSGTVVQTADLGLPELPAVAGQLGGGLASLISGSNTLRVWYSGPDKARIALLSTLGETDLIRNGQDAWLWESRGNTATHYRLPEQTGTGRARPHATPTDLPSTPQEAADLALDAVAPSTEVTTGRTARVAGRNAYELVLTPRDKDSLLGQIRVAIDAREHLPLRVEVYPKGSDEPAFKVAFTQISFERPDADRFRFNPPPGVQVSEGSAGEAATEGKTGVEGKTGPEGKLGPGGKLAPGAEGTPAENSTVVGEGWTAVFVSRIGVGSDNGTAGDEAEPEIALLGQLPKVNGSWGSGRLLSSKLFSALLTDDGRLLIGAVAPEKLYEVAASAAGQVK